MPISKTFLFLLHQEFFTPIVKATRGIGLNVFFSGMDMSVAALPCREDAALFLHDARIRGPDDMMRRCIKWTQWWIEGLRKRRQAWKKETDGGKGFKIKYYKGGSWKNTWKNNKGLC